MKSESKWRRQLKGKHSDSITGKRKEYNETYDEDDTVGMEYQKNNSKKLMIAGAIAIGGYASYKAGFLQKGIKAGLEYAADFKGHGTEGYKTLGNWTRKDTGVPGKSLIRQKGIIKNTLQGKQGVQTFTDTLEDFKDLKDDLIKNAERINKASKDPSTKLFRDTSLLYEIGGMNDTLEQLPGKAKKGYGIAKEKISKGIVENMTQTKEQAEKQIKRTGYRSATLGDLLEEKVVGGHNTLVSKFNEYNLDDQDGTLKSIEKFLSSTAYDSDGKAIKDISGKVETLFSSGQYKGLTLDGNIMIDEMGKMIDTRTASNSMKEFVNTMAYDYKIPVIGVNPLRFTDMNKYMSKEINHGLLHSDTIQPHITNKIGRHTLGEDFGDVPLMFVNGDVFKFTGDFSNLEKIKDNMHIREIPKGNSGYYTLPKEVDVTRKMANINMSDIKKFDEDDPFHKRAYGKLSEILDVGFQEKNVRAPIEKDGSFSKYFNPDTYIEGASKKVSQVFKPYDKKTREYDLGDVFGVLEDDTHTVHVAFNNKRNFKDIIDSESSEEIGGYFKQFFAGRGKDGEGLKDVTSATTLPFYLIDRVNQGFSSFGAGLSNKSAGSAFSQVAGLVTKRFLPLYAGYQAYEYINYLSEKEEDEGNGSGQKTNITQRANRKLVELDLGWHEVKDKLGITGLAKKASELMPGSEHITDIPGFGILDMSETLEERQDYYETGMDPVRKGRYWGLGNTPLTGAKTMYFEPNRLKRVEGDARFSESMWGSREEYFQNKPFPTPSHPLAPIKHFVTDKYHYDMKHYHDRPYLLSSPEFANTPIVGPVLGATVGELIKPTIKMHEEYWDEGAEESLEVAQESTKREAKAMDNKEDVETAKKVTRASTGAPDMEVPINQARVNLGKKIMTPSRDKERDLEIYNTSSGNMKIVDIDEDRDLDDVNEDLKKYSIKSVDGATDRVGFNVASRHNTKLEDAIAPNSAGHIIGDQYNTMSDVAGILGFGVRAFGTGEANDGKTIIESSGYNYSMNKQFWDKDIGGLGGDISEMYRRLLQKRDNTEYYNPVRNNMPDWMPDDTYFTDFQSGDPYSKVSKGEMRLPGEGYERTWGIDNPTRLSSGVSLLGKSKSDMVKHFMNQEEEPSSEYNRISKSDKQVSNKIKKAWSKSGLALETDVEVYDEKNDITGAYDARISDPSSRSRYAIANIYSVDAEEFKSIKKSKTARMSHQKQVNFLMKQTKDKKGYVHYVNREDENQQVAVKLNYSKKLYQESINDLNEAKDLINTGLENRSIKRGDLYKPIDRFRILADVAPYSTEYTEMKSQMSKAKLSKKDEAEVSAINKRVTEQKKPMRIFDYKFKTAKITKEKVKIKKVIDANTFVVEGYEDNPIKLAGLHISSDKTKENHDEAQKAIGKYIKKGSTITIGFDADDNKKIAKDQLDTIRATVYKNGKNVNREMLKKGLAKEKEDDWSATSVHSRFSPGQIRFGKVWESIAHMDTPINTKFLQVRSAKENYERREVWGEDYQDWRHPIKDFLIPEAHKTVNRKGGLIIGAAIGSMFGSTAHSKMIGATIGFTATAIGKAVAKGKEIKTGEKWIPKRRQKDRDINEYLDMLEHVKHKRLYDKYSREAKDKYGVDVDELIREEKEEGNERKKRMKELERVKKDIKINPGKTKKAHEIISNSEVDLKYYDKKEKDVKGVLKGINQEINENKDFREVKRYQKEVTKAIDHHNKSKETMYGYEQGDPIQNLLKALPKKERDYMKHFIDAPEQERKGILDITPKYMRRALQSTWGMEVDKKESLTSYFSSHQLPDEEWVGWEEGTDLDDVKVKLVKHEGRDFKHFNMWEDDVDKANAAGAIPLPKVNFRSNSEDIRGRLYELLNNEGLEDIRIRATKSPEGASFNIDIEEDRRNELEDRINNMTLA